jgi:hypothetical protein
LLSEVVGLNCSAHIETNLGMKTAKGNVSEVGLLNYLMNSGIDVHQIMELKKNVEFVIPFNSTRKK